jgi:Zn-dependent protease with chaperone function
VTEEEWDALVRRLDEKARADPSGYRLRVGALALVGYGFLAFAVVVLLALAALVVALAIAGPALLIKLLLPIGALILVIARSLWIKVEPPVGIELKHGDAPALDSLVAETRKAVDGPKVHTTLVDGELNAGVVQVPRFGVFGGQRNYLVLGLPLLQALRPKEFHAVLAHELGHLSKSHGRFGTWIYRVRGTWWKLLATLEEQRRFGTFVFRRFFEWYAPYFNAYSFALARAHEFEADRAAVAAAGAPAAGTALARLGVAARHLDGSYWPKLYERSMREPEPPRTAFAPLQEELPRSALQPEASTWVDQDLQVEATTTDTHPSLADRLSAIGVSAEDVKRRLTETPHEETAAQRFLGDRVAALVERLDRDWHELVAPGWRERYEEVQASAKRIEELEARSGELGDEELSELAHLTWDVRGDDEALPRFRAVLERDPRNAAANFAAGRILLDRGEDEGLRHLEAAIESDPEAVLPACELAIGYLEERGRSEEAERYRELGSGRYDLLQLADEERGQPTAGGELVEHDLPPDTVEEARRQLARLPGIASALLLRRRMQHLDDEFPLYVLFVAPARKPWRPLGGDREELTEKIVAELDLPFAFWVLSPGAFSTQMRSLRGRFPQAEIYRG